MFLSAIHKLVNSMWNKGQLHEWKESIIVPIHKKGDKRGIIIVRYHCYHVASSVRKSWH
jgi:hypothetical protein